MSGLGQQFLPKPQFSSVNPYWQDPAKSWGQFASYVRPLLSARDFLYATTWEIWRWDIHGAFCVRQATIRTVRINTRMQWRSQITDLWKKHQEMENKNEKVA